MSALLQALLKQVEQLSYEERLVWVIHSDEEFVLVDRSPEPDGFLRSGDRLEGEEVVPGFAIAVSELFEEWYF